MPAGATSRYALGAGGVGAARPTPAASLISVSRYALGTRRTALRAEGTARLCAGPPRAAQPLAAIAASRYALGADGVGAVRARAPAAARSRPRAARSAPKALAQYLSSCDDSSTLTPFSKISKPSMARPPSGLTENLTFTCGPFRPTVRITRVE